MGKQIGFYLSEQSNLLIEEYLEKAGFGILSVPMPTASLLLVPGLTAENLVRPNYPKRFFVLKTQSDKVQTHFVEAQNYHTVKELYSPIIEYWSSAGQNRQGEMHKGRLYFETGYYENGLWIEKNEEFLKAADKLFRWFKKTFKKVDAEPFRGSYTSDGVLEWVRQGGKIAIN